MKLKEFYNLHCKMQVSPMKKLPVMSASTVLATDGVLVDLPLLKAGVKSSKQITKLK